VNTTEIPPNRAPAGTGATAAAEAEARLVQDCREGKTGAVLELFRTHWEPALAYANLLSRSSQDAEDVAATAFLKSLTAMRRGKGPDGPVRPYLLRAVRTAACDRYSSAEHPSGRIIELADGQGTDGLHNGSQEHDFVAEAFAALPLRWQKVLWYVEIEGLKPREAAPLLDVAPNALSALLRRARKGLREAYLLVYLRDSESRGCDSMLRTLAESAVGRTTVAGQAKVDKHVRTCRNCRGALQGLRGVHSRMQGLLNPGLLPAVLSPLTAVRILELLSSPSPGPLGRIAETINESADVARTLFQGLKAIGATAAVVVMVLPAAPNAATPDSGPHGHQNGCGPYGTSVGCLHRSAMAPDYLQLAPGTRSSQ
jgi:RNA polymerase sigma factor (sigma-70 family)